MTLRLWYVPNTAAPTPQGKANARIIERFRERHPHVDLQGTAGIRIPQIGSTAALLMAIAGGIAPDVVESQGVELYDFVQQGFLLPLDEYIGAIPEEERYEMAPKRVWDAARIVGPDGEGDALVFEGLTEPCVDHVAPATSGKRDGRTHRSVPSSIRRMSGKT